MCWRCWGSLTLRACPSCRRCARAATLKAPLACKPNARPHAHGPLQGGLAFPAVLERLHLPAFDLCKVLEPFVLQLPTLPR